MLLGELLHSPLAAVQLAAAEALLDLAKASVCGGGLVAGRCLPQALATAARGLTSQSLPLSCIPPHRSTRTAGGGRICGGAVSAAQGRSHHHRCCHQR